MVYIREMDQQAQTTATYAFAAVWKGRRLVTILEEHFVPQSRTGSPLDSPSSVFQIDYS